MTLQNKDSGLKYTFQKAVTIWNFEYNGVFGP